MFITEFTTDLHLPLSWAKSMQSMPPSNLSKIHFNIILRQVFPLKPGMHLSSPP
jgi:hypothetical protein